MRRHAQTANAPEAKLFLNGVSSSPSGDGAYDVTMHMRCNALGVERVRRAWGRRTTLTVMSERDANTKRLARAMKVVARYPLYTLLGGDRHHLLNEDMFEQAKRETAGRIVEAIESGDEQAANEGRAKMMGLLSGAAE